MQPNPYAAYMYPYPNGVPNGQMPVRYMIPPAGYRQSSPPFANQSYDRFGTIPAVVRPPNTMQPVRYPPGYVPPGTQMPPAAVRMPNGNPPRATTPQQQQLQPPSPYYYNPNGKNQIPQAPPPKKGAKEYKDNAFTIAPDGTNNETIKGLVSNHEINDLLKHKGTKVKVSKIYRITKTKPDIIADSSSDEELPPPIQQPASLPPPPQSVQRPISSSSSGSHCSTCSNCSCNDCRARDRAHTYDDCPDCRAERSREQARRQRRR